MTWRYFESEWEDGVLKFRPCRADDGGDITARSQYNAREMVMVFQDSDAPSVDWYRLPSEQMMQLEGLVARSVRPAKCHLRAHPWS